MDYSSLEAMIQTGAVKKIPDAGGYELVIGEHIWLVGSLQDAWVFVETLRDLDLSNPVDIEDICQAIHEQNWKGDE
jgi:hypothetical protein